MVHMNQAIFERILNLSRQTGDKFIFLDPASRENAFVVMALSDYESLAAGVETRGKQKDERREAQDLSFEKEKPKSSEDDRFLDADLSFESDYSGLAASPETVSLSRPNFSVPDTIAPSPKELFAAPPVFENKLDNRSINDSLETEEHFYLEPTE